MQRIDNITSLEHRVLNRPIIKNWLYRYMHYTYPRDKLHVGINMVKRNIESNGNNTGNNDGQYIGIN